MMPSLSFTYWSALVVAGALALYFGGRQAETPAAWRGFATCLPPARSDTACWW